MLEAGRYRGKAVNAALGVTGTGKEQVGVEFELLDQPGQTITWYGYFTDKTTEGTLKALRACGWQGDDLSELTGITDNEVILVVEHETDDQGQIRAKVRWVNTPGGLAMKDTMDPKAAKAFAAKMKGQVVALNGGKPSAKPQAKKPRPDDDIPF